MLIIRLFHLLSPIIFNILSNGIALLFLSFHLSFNGQFNETILFLQFSWTILLHTFEILSRSVALLYRLFFTLLNELLLLFLFYRWLLSLSLTFFQRFIYFLLLLFGLLSCRKGDLQLINWLTPGVNLVGCTYFCRSYWRLSLFLNATLTSKFIFSLSHLLLNFLTIFLELLNFFLIEKPELIHVFREVKPPLQLDPSFVERGAWKVVNSPNVDTLMNHPKESRRQLNQVHHRVIRGIFIDIIDKVAGSSLNIFDVWPVLDDFWNFPE